MARRGSTIDVEITEGAIRVRSRERVLTIVATTPPADLEEDADFYIELDDIEFWDAPHDETAIEIDELQKISGGHRGAGGKTWVERGVRLAGAAVF